MPIIALNTNESEILTSQMLDDIFAIADGRYEVAWLGELEEARYGEIEIAFGAIPYEKTSLMTSLRWLQLTTAGVDKSNDASRYPNPAFQLTNASGAFGGQIAEHVLAFFLGFARGLHTYRDNQLQKRWSIDHLPAKLNESTVGIIGLGDIGKTTARLCSALGARVLAVKRSQSKKPGYVEELFFDMEQSLDNLLRRSDYVALCLPLTADTQNIIDARRIALLRQGSVFVNIGRGLLIDQDALTQRLEQGDIFAGLDVFTQEPLPPESPLWQLPNCWITPHMAGHSSTEMPYIAALFVNNLRRYVAGGRLINQVDFNTGY